MKPLLSFLLLMFVLGYAHTQQGNCEKGLNALYLYDNGVTIKARKCNRNMIGEKHTLNGVEYEIVDNETLRRRYRSGVNLSRVVTTFVTDMSHMFGQDTSFNQNINNWDTSQVTDMSFMFYKAYSFNQDITYWDTSKVLDMSNMFTMAYSFNQDITYWDTSKVFDMGYMFYNATSFNQDLSWWKVGNVNDCFYFDKDSQLSRAYRPNFVKCRTGNY